MKKTRNRVVAFVTGLLLSGTLVFAGLEVGTYTSDLVATNPTNSDLASTADDHLRLIKSTIKATFPNISGAVTPTHTELNYVDGVTSAIQTQLNAKLASASYTAADVLTKIKTVDGAASGLDADLLDGSSSAAFAAASHVHSGNDITSGTVPDARLGAATSQTATWTGCTGGGTVSVKTVVVGSIASVKIANSVSCTGSSTSFGLSGAIPAAAQPASGAASCYVPAMDNGVVTEAVMSISSGSSNITFIPNTGSASWTASGSRALRVAGMSCTYPLN